MTQADIDLVVSQPDYVLKIPKVGAVQMFLKFVNDDVIIVFHFMNKQQFFGATFPKKKPTPAPVQE